MMHPMRKLEELENEMEDGHGYTSTSRWMIPYADFLTILLGFFIILYASVVKENQQLAQAETKAQQQAVMENPVKKSETEVEKQIESLQNLENDINQKLQIDGHQVKVSADPRGVVISFQEKIFFAPGQATLSPQAERTLDKLASVLKQTSHPIRVEGHTDNTPIQTTYFPSNWELSTARATKIVRSLVERHSFPPQRLSAAGYGEFYPVADNSTIEGKQKNRRVDIVLLNPQPSADQAGRSESGSPISPKE